MRMLLRPAVSASRPNYIFFGCFCRRNSRPCNHLPCTQICGDLRGVVAWK